MGQIVAYSKTLADAITTAGVKATNNIRNAVPPCVLVEPTPRIEYDVLDGTGFATWRIVCLAAGKGDLADATKLEDLAERVRSVMEPISPIVTAEPGAYPLIDGEPKPAYVLTFQNHVTPEEE